MPNRRNRNSRALATQGIGLAFSVPQVVAHRVLRMARASHPPSRRDRDEFRRMSAEKVSAFYESWNAMMLESFRVAMESGWSVARLLWFPWLSTPRSRRALSNRLQRSALSVLGHGIAPVHRRAVANAKRLRRG